MLHMLMLLVLLVESSYSFVYTQNSVAITMPSEVVSPSESLIEEDIFATPGVDALPKPDFTPPSRATILLRRFGIQILFKYCALRAWLARAYNKTILSFKELLYTV